MNKGELVQSIADSCDYSKAEAERALEAVLESIKGELKGGGQVQLVGFGTFGISNRAARTAKNPQTGEPVQVSARKVPKFTAGKGLKDLVNGNVAKGASKGGAAKAKGGKK